MDAGKQLVEDVLNTVKFPPREQQEAVARQMGPHPRPTVFAGSDFDDHEEMYRASNAALDPSPPAAISTLYGIRRPPEVGVPPEWPPQGVAKGEDDWASPAHLLDVATGFRWLHEVGERAAAGEHHSHFSTPAVLYRLRRPAPEDVHLDSHDADQTTWMFRASRMLGAPVRVDEYSRGELPGWCKFRHAGQDRSDPHLYAPRVLPCRPIVQQYQALAVMAGTSLPWADLAAVAWEQLKVWLREGLAIAEADFLSRFPDPAAALDCLADGARDDVMADFNHPALLWNLYLFVNCDHDQLTTYPNWFPADYSMVPPGDPHAAYQPWRQGVHGLDPLSLPPRDPAHAILSPCLASADVLERLAVERMGVAGFTSAPRKGKGGKPRKPLTPLDHLILRALAEFPDADSAAIAEAIGHPDQAEYVRTLRNRMNKRQQRAKAAG